MLTSVMQSLTYFLCPLGVLVSFDPPTGGNCSCEYTLPCCTTQSTPVWCGEVRCPWEWLSFGQNTLTSHTCPEGVSSPVGATPPNTQHCEYRKGKCLNALTGECGFEQWVFSECGPFDAIIISGTKCP